MIYYNIITHFIGLEAPAKLVRLYQVNAWPQDSQVPNSSDILINLMGDVEKWHNDVKDNHMNKVILISRNFQIISFLLQFHEIFEIFKGWYK